MKKSTPNPRAFDDAREVFWMMVQHGAPHPFRNYAKGMERQERKLRNLRSNRRAVSTAAKAR